MPEGNIGTLVGDTLNEQVSQTLSYIENIENFSKDCLKALDNLHYFVLDTTIFFKVHQKLYWTTFK